jgi:hypothetical protein
MFVVIAKRVREGGVRKDPVKYKFAEKREFWNCHNLEHVTRIGCVRHVTMILNHS